MEMDPAATAPSSPKQSLLTWFRENDLFSLEFVVALAVGGYHIYTSLFGLLPAMQHRTIHLGGVTLMCFLMAVRKNSGVKRLFIALLAALTVVVTVFNLTRLSPQATLERGFQGPNQLEMISGIILIILVLEVARRSSGWPLVILGLVGLSYAFLGPYLPGGLFHRGYDLKQLVEVTAWGTEGIFGTPLAAAADFISIYVILGALLERSGAGNFFVELARRATRRMVGGPGMAAVGSSALFGSISGVGMANVVTTGTFTIPMMKKVGFRPAFAGAVEAVASSGGQIMPPVMGAAAFIMAEMTGTPYADVVLIALIPSLLYFFSTAVMIYMEAKKHGIDAEEPQPGEPSVGSLLRGNFVYFIPIGVLIYYLVFLKSSATKAAVYALLTMVVIMVLKLGRRAPGEFLLSIRDAGRLMVSVTPATAAAGILVGVLTMTGLGLRLTQVVTAISGGNLFVMLLLTMVVSLILGMGLPTSAAYILVAALVAPSMVQAGVNLMSAHMFAFYFACMSLITPPVGVVSYAAASLAKATFWDTGWTATKLASAGFIVPFMFVYEPSLILQGGDWGTVALAVPSALLGCIALAAGIQGWFLGRLNLLGRAIALAAALLLIKPGLTTDLIGLGIFALAILLRRKQDAGVRAAG